MRQRREVSRRADRTLSGHDGRQAPGQQGFQQANRGRRHTRGALGQAPQLQRHHKAGDGDGRRRADAGRVGQDDVALKGGQIGVADAHAGQLAEAGVDPIDRLALGQDARHRGGALGDDRRRSGVQAHTGAAVDGAPVGQGHLAGAKDDLGQSEYSDWPFGAGVVIVPSRRGR